ncbi:S-layer homology domain-containing protein [Paenibacillus sp. BR2-3]|uniref:S-layer homology domain-containing protein n=1 Tax=Paenibacillus sp. BR2-3 TaxID=3048494 RepID=UPI00397773F5
MKRNVTATLAAMVLVTGLLSPIGGVAASAAEAIQTVQAAQSYSSTGTAISAGKMKTFTNVGPDHWALLPLQRWSGNGIIKGYEDGSFRPAKLVTKAEFSAIINRIFNYQEQAAQHPVDVLEAAWFKSDIAKGIAAGYITVDGDKRIHPTRPFTRGEAALALQKVFRLSGEPAVSFKDLKGVSAETSAAISALAAGGYIQGYPGGLFKPEGVITRAELTAMSDRMVRELVDTAGETSLGTVKGNVVINRADVTLKDTTIEGNLYLSPGIGEGNATLERVKVTGTTFIAGGGEHSVGFKDSTIGEMRIAKPKGIVRVYASGTTAFETLYVQSGAILEENSLTGAGFTNVQVNAGKRTVEFKGNFEVITTTDSVETGLTLNISGTVGKLTLNSPSRIVLAEKAQLASLKMTPNSKSSVIQGNGNIEVLENNAEGVNLGGSTLPKGTANYVTVNPSPTANAASGADPWTLVWNDEFNDRTIDPAKWTYDLGDGTAVGNPGWGNNELQWYTNEEENVKEEDGKLIITARKEAQGGKDYTSSRIKTKGLFSKKYGKFEIRAKAPSGKGLWPAIWMLPENSVYGEWASSGELDIMEGWGSRPNTVAGTIHYGAGWPDNVYSGKEYVFPGGSTIEQFHLKRSETRDFSHGRRSLFFS